MTKTVSLEIGTEAYKKLIPSWEKLYKKASSSTVYVSPAWAQAWLRTMGETHDPVIIAAWEGDELKALWPFCEVVSLFNTGLWPLGYHTADDSAPLIEGESEEIWNLLKEGLAKALSEYSFVWIPLLKESRCKILNDGTASWLSQTRHASNNKTKSLAGLSFEEFLDKHVGSKTRKTMRYNERRFSEFGAISYKCAETRQEAAECFERIKWIERQSWKHSEKAGLFALDESRSFYKRLLPELADNGQLRIDTMYVGEDCIAYQLGFVRGKYYGMYTIAHNKAYKDLSPGLHLQLHVFEKLFSKGCTDFDFLQGNQSYKERYEPETEALNELTLYPNTIGGMFNKYFMSAFRKAKHISFNSDKEDQEP